MNNYIKSSVIAMSLAAIVSSCDMDAPTISTLDESSVFSTYSLAEAEVMSIHISFGETNSYRGRFLPYYGLNTDLETGSGTYPSLKDQATDKQSLWNYSTLSTNGQMNTDNNAYAKFYEGIERANLAIEGIRKHGNIEHNKDMAHLLGEALTLRAVVYNDLVKAWGDVPARFVPNNPTNVYMPRANKDSIYKQLLADLAEAEQYCYWPKESSITKSTERVSKAFVKGLRARIALYAGGSSQRADGVRLSNDPELSQANMYKIAKDECLSIINQGCNTLGNFKDNFTNLCKDIVKAGGESIFEIPFSDGRGRVLYTFGVKHNAKDQYTQQSQGGVNGPLPTLYYDYDVDDIRRDITCVPYDWSKELVDGRSKQQLRSLNKWCFGKLRYEWMNRIVTSTNDDGVNWQYLRLADVYLVAAEAINEIDGASAAAPYLKAILDRALPAAKVTAYMSAATASKSAFFNAIVEQRGLELAGEMLRKADLIRWNLLSTKLAEAKSKMKQLRMREGAYADLPKKIYYTYAEDGETLKFYGLNHGDTDDEGAMLTGWDSTDWITETKLEDKTIDALYTQDPDKNQFWPIWQTFIDSSNGMLSND